MELPHFFNKEDVEKIISRINSLTPEHKRVWGKMSVDQMLAHCAETFKVATDKIKIKRGFLGYTLGPLLKKFYTNEKPFNKGTPTHKDFIIINKRNFEKEKQELIALIQEFSKGGPEKVTKQAHAFFGKLKPEQWARGMYKHMDHHLKQFGV